MRERGGLSLPDRILMVFSTKRPRVSLDDLLQCMSCAESDRCDGFCVLEQYIIVRTRSWDRGILDLVNNRVIEGVHRSFGTA
jgi:hypothetical protein